MTKISQYSTDVNITGNDKWIGSDAQNFLITKNFTPNNLASFFNENNVIDIGASIRYRYQTLLPGEAREQGTISFETEIGPQVNFSAITTFLIAKNTLKGNTVTQYLDFLVDGKVLLSKASNINIFGYYKITSIEPWIPNTDFFVVEVDFLAGNGFIYEDLDYLVSLVDKAQEVPPPVWGSITGDIEDQTDLIDYIASQIITPTLVALPFTTDHISATGNQYVIGDIVYYNGNVYRCIASNDSLLPTNTSYWTNLGVGYPLAQQPSDWNATSGNNQILNKPTIPTNPTLQSVTDAGNTINDNVIEFYDGGNLHGIIGGSQTFLDFNNYTAGNYKYLLDTFNGFSTYVQDETEYSSLDAIGLGFINTIYSTASQFNVNGFSKTTLGGLTTKTLFINFPTTIVGTNKTQTFQDADGIIALLSDIPSGVVTSVTATSPITSSGGTTPDISTSMNTNKLIGRSTAGTGVMEEITVGTGLSLSGGTLNATAQTVGFEQNFLLMGS
jgi:hypothetical protein